MKLREFNVVRDSTIYPEIYCLGSILNEQIAAQSVICAILKYIVQNSQFHVHLYKLYLKITLV